MRRIKSERAVTYFAKCIKTRERGVDISQKNISYKTRPEVRTTILLPPFTIDDKMSRKFFECKFMYLDES